MGKTLKELHNERIKMLNDIEGGPQQKGIVAGPKALAIQNSFKKATGEDDESKKKPSKFDNILSYLKGK